MFTRFARTALKRSSTSFASFGKIVMTVGPRGRCFSASAGGQQQQPPLPEDIEPLTDKQGFELTKLLSVGLYQETLAVRDLTIQILEQLKEKNPHPEGSKEYVDFVFKNNFTPENHPGFFQVYDTLVKEYNKDMEPFIVFGQLNKFIVEQRNKQNTEELLKTPEGFSLLNYDNSILLSFMGMHNTLYFPMIQKNFGVDYLAAASPEQCFQETVGMFKTSGDQLVQFVKATSNNPDSFKDEQSVMNTTAGLLT